ncbi:MAG TPA: hypothetical protein VMZ31_01045 [Phycisphaerae bacterium]|nr:hypothetical protein [Phycisphaerae bacterium]
MSVFSPYLACDAHPDTRSLGDILRWPDLHGERDQELAEALWRWMIDRHTGTYHFLDPIEEPDETLTGHPVKDPVRLLNSYGYMLCGSHANVAASILRQGGLPARCTGCTGHNITEVYYDGAWHLIDVDMDAIHYKRDGDRLVIASCADLCADPDLVASPVKRSDPYYTSDEHAAKVAKGQYGPGFWRAWPQYWYQLHTLDFALRPGETLTYYHRPQGRFHYPPALTPDIKRWYQQGWAGPKEKHQPGRSYANARLHYRPSLPGDLAAPGVGRRGLTAEAGGLRAGRDGELTIRVIAPYVIAGRTPDLTRPEVKCDGAVLHLGCSDPLEATVRLPFTGQQRNLAFEREGDRWRADFSAVVDTCYEYELSIRLPAGARVDSLDLTTWMQVGPCALPMLSPNGASMTLRLADPTGEPTLPRIVDLIRAAGRQPERLVRGRLQDDPTLKVVGQDGVELLGLLEPPDGGRTEWVKLWAAVQSDVETPPADKAVRLELGPSVRGPWTTLAAQAIATDHQRCHFSAEAVHQFDQPQCRCWVRLVSPNTVGGFRAAMHYLPEEKLPAAGSPLEITHRWSESGQMCEHIERIDAPSDGYQYRVPTGSNPEPETTTLSVPSTDA